MSYHNGMRFTANDRDEDLESDVNCAVKYSGGWWYNSCFHVNLHGEMGNDEYGMGIIWHSLKGFSYSLKESMIMIQRT